MTKHAKTGVAAAAIVFLVAGMPATAADNDAYFRIGAGLDRLSDTRFLDTDCRSEAPAALYGCGLGKNGDVLSTVGGFGRTAAFEVGWGRSGDLHGAAGALDRLSTSPHVPGSR